jgi:putative FmdB family regulatory protein
MPIFEYHCTNCNQTCELLIRNATVPICPHCQSEHLTRLLSMPAAPGKSNAIIQRARQQAAREGHFSNYSPGERKKIR